VVQLMPLPPSCFLKIQNGLTFLVPAFPDYHGKEAVERVFYLSAEHLMDLIHDIRQRLASAEQLGNT